MVSTQNAVISASSAIHRIAQIFPNQFTKVGFHVCCQDLLMMYTSM